MQKAWLMIIGIIVAVFVITFLKKEFSNLKSLPQERERFPYKRKDFLLNTPEREFFESLQPIIPAGYIVFPQVLLSKIIKVSSSRKESFAYWNKINRKTVDFVVFEKQYLKPVIAIEYDGKTHNRKDRQTRDRFVNRALEVVGIEILHIKHQEGIYFQELERKSICTLTTTP